MFEKTKDPPPPPPESSAIDKPIDHMLVIRGLGCLDLQTPGHFLTLFFLPQCWETRVGQEMYKLLIFDLLTGVAISLFIQFPRK